MSKFIEPPVLPIAAGGPPTDWRPTSCLDVCERMMHKGVPLLRPVWLKPLADAWNAIVHVGNQRQAFTTASQHGKSLVNTAGLLYFCLVRPGVDHAFISFADVRTIEAREDFIRHAGALGLEPRTDNNTVFLRGQSSVFFGTAGKGLVGRPIPGVICFDDLVKDGKAARSPVQTKALNSWLEDVAEQRVHPKPLDGSAPGGSMLLVQTRWSRIDIWAFLEERERTNPPMPGQPVWRFTRLAAICDDEQDGTGRALGEALWPERRPLEWLLNERKRKPRSFNSSYQGLPQEDADKVFSRDPVRYTPRPDGAPQHSPVTWAYGLDVGASVSGDFTVLVEGYRHGDLLVLTRLFRMQGLQNKWLGPAGRFLKKRPAAPIRIDASSGADNNAADALRTAGCYVDLKPTGHASKLDRAEGSGLIDAWEDGRVWVPEGEEWEPLIEEFREFSGSDQYGVHDDTIDGAASLAARLGMQIPKAKNDAGAPFRIPSAGGDSRNSHYGHSSRDGVVLWDAGNPRHN